MASPLALMVTVTGAYETQEYVSIPTISGGNDSLPGERTYSVTVVAHCSSAEEYECWRALIGQTIEIKES